MRGARRQQLVALLGASGAGKSSLMRAGVLPRSSATGATGSCCRRFARRSAFRRAGAGGGRRARGGQRLAAMARRAGGRKSTQGAVRLRPRRARKYGANEAQILIPIDQGEELFGTADKAEAERCLRCSTPPSTSGCRSSCCWRCARIISGSCSRPSASRSPFEELAQAHAARARARHHRGAARVAGLAVDNALVDAAMKDAATDDALPLLACSRCENLRPFRRQQAALLAEYLVFGDTTAGISPLENAVRKRADEVLADARPTPEDLR